MRRDPKRPILETGLSLQMSPFHGIDGDGWTMSIEDDTSGTLVLDVQITMEQMGELLGARHVTAPGRLFQGEHYGKVCETERVRVPMDSADWKGDDADPDAIAARLARQEGYKPSDGWKVDDVGRFNGHRYDREKGYELTVRRYVDPAG